jgi:hypothetical protein
VTRPLPDHLTDAPQTTTRQDPKGSDHDHHRNAEDGRPTHDRDAAGTANGDRADKPDDGDRSDTDRPRRTRPGTAVGRPERAADGRSLSTPDPSVTLTAGPDGALWVVVDGADVNQLAARINAACDALLRTGSRLK